MADVDPGNIIKITVLGKLSGVHDVQNSYTMRFSDLSGATSADVLDDLVTIFQALYTILAPIISVLITFQGIRAVNATKGTDIGQLDFPTLTGGTAAGDALPSQVAYGLTMKTRILRRVGRKFIGVANEGSSNGNGAVQPAALTTLATAGAELMTPQAGGGTREYEYGIVDNLFGNFEAFIQVVVASTFVTQRRRRVGVGT